MHTECAYIIDVHSHPHLTLFHGIVMQCHVEMKTQSFLNGVAVSSTCVYHRFVTWLLTTIPHTSEDYFLFYMYRICFLWPIYLSTFWEMLGFLFNWIENLPSFDLYISAFQLALELPNPDIFIRTLHQLWSDMPRHHPTVSHWRQQNYLVSSIVYLL